MCFEQKYEKYLKFLAKNFHFSVIKFSVYLNRHVFVMEGTPVIWRSRLPEYYNSLHMLFYKITMSYYKYNIKTNTRYYFDK